MGFDKEGAVATLLQPLDIDSFFDTYWEKFPVHIERTDTEHFANILSIESVDALVAASELYFPDVQLISQPDGIAKDQYIDKDNRLLPLRLIEHYATGATLAIARADAKIGTLGNFCRHLQSEWQMQCRANVYLSPPGHQGFKPHYDTHDVFIIQASGKKQFNFYTNNLDLPFNEDEFSSQNFLPGDKTEEITLSAGDTLYIPRGVTHDAIALEQSPSLHITVGIYPFIVRDLLQELVQLASEQSVGFRHSVPLINQAPASIQQDTTAVLRGLLDQVVTQDNINKVLASYQDQVAIQCMQDSSGLLSRQFRSSPVTEESIVRVRPGHVISIHTDAGSISDSSDDSDDQGTLITTLRLPGQVVEFHQPMGAAVQWLVEQQVARVSQLPHLSSEQKLH